MWYTIDNAQSIETPALAIYPARVRQNIETMLSMVGSPNRLCPHVKTHKMAKVTTMYREAGVTQFKCATLRELEMVASAGAEFALLAYQPVGPNVALLANVAGRFADVQFGAVADNQKIVDQLEQVARERDVCLTVLVDVEAGMGRTGILANDEAALLYARIDASPHLIAGGLHVYDGHIHDTDPRERQRHVEQSVQPSLDLRARLLREGRAVDRFICGGTGSFPVHAHYMDRICSPGTPIFWDAGYAKTFPDLPFQPAAVLLTRVISRRADRCCLDLGHKAVAAEMPPPRVEFLDFAGAREVLHSEEHLVIELDSAALEVGDLVYALPRHICPTVALHEQVVVVEGGRATAVWPTTARNRSTTHALL